MQLRYLNPPAGSTLEWPTDIAENDTSYLRRYIKWKYPAAFRPEQLPLTTHTELVDYLTDKGYTFGLPCKGKQAK